jgi:hypothetical protein
MSYLIYVNELGPNYKGDNTYEFIFSNSLEEIWGDSWESNPANGYPSPPDLNFIDRVATLMSNEITLSVIQKSDYFSMTDCMDDVISLAWENEIDEIDFTIKKRLVFRFGETEQSVKNKLYERDIVLEFEKKIVYEN